MNLETIFVRADSDPRPAPCDVAGAPHSHATHGDVWVGMVAGQHTAADAIEQAWVEPSAALAWLDGNGYTRRGDSDP